MMRDDRRARVNAPARRIVKQCVAPKSMLILVLAGLTAAQADVKVEVASIKPIPADRGERYVITGGRTLRCSCVLGALIQFAYNTRDYRFDSLPSWVQDQFYLITAQADTEGALTQDEFREMARALLAERFHLRVHVRTERVAVYALVIDKGGPKIARSAPESKRSRTELHRKIELKRYDMTEFAQRLTVRLARRVVDLTGLTGFYDLDLEWAAEPEPAVSGDEAGPSFFAAVRAQLGLRLEPRKDYPLEVLVIDHAERPAAN